jgi:hypothetical protein
MSAVNDRKTAVLFNDGILLPVATYHSGKLAGGGADCQENV